MKNLLREKRQRAGLAQQGLGVKAGVSVALIVGIEKWGYRPTPRIQARIAEALGCTPEGIWLEESDGVSNIAPACLQEGGVSMTS